VAEYRRLVEARILELVANHPTIKAIQQGQKIDDWQLLELERTLTRELDEGDLEVTPENLRKVLPIPQIVFLVWCARCWTCNICPITRMWWRGSLKIM
jgi:hypothetical protein